MKNTTTVIAIIAIATSATSAGAAVYDETIDGDLGRLSSPTTLDVQVGVTSVIGTIGEADDEDFLRFVIEPGELLTEVVITSVTFTGGNTATGFRFYREDANGNLGQVAPGAFDATDVSTDFLTVWNLSSLGGAPLGAGTYAIAVSETSSSVQQYAYDIVVIPGPATLSLLSVGGLLVARRRR